MLYRGGFPDWQEKGFPIEVGLAPGSIKATAEGK
jgi:hypothetical protein